MKRRRRRGDRFSDESVDPMNYVSNLSDAMLVLAVGMMLALIVHWNVDISTGGRSSENVGETVAAEGQGGQSAIDRDDALSFTPEELERRYAPAIRDYRYPLVLMYLVDAVAADGQPRTQEVTPWAYRRLERRAKQRACQNKL